NKVCKLNRSIYGLKLASRSWNQCFDEIIKEYDFVQNEDDHCVYKKTRGRALTFIVLYVDDVLLIGNDIPMLTSVKASFVINVDGQEVILTLANKSQLGQDTDMEQNSRDSNTSSTDKGLDFGQQPNVNLGS
ncbi:reverse transcriptase domain-containing protein, partial [Corynebacterium parakroppenstedtii]|uniref:reverse transcriptase domain-containing protein n=1 Tax=Corynebacterium parakroppenstedtii TaxID=2828363 RepID=UPI001F1AA284